VQCLHLRVARLGCCWLMMRVLTSESKASHNLTSSLITDWRRDAKAVAMFFKNSQPISVGVWRWVLMPGDWYQVS